MFCRSFQRGEREGGGVPNKFGRVRRVGVHGSDNSQCLFRVSSKHTRIIKSSDDNHYDTLSVDATLYDDTFFGPVPSETEIQNALRSLQQVFGSASPFKNVSNICYYKLDSEVGHVTNTPIVDQVSSDGLETDWKEPSLFSYNPRMLQADGYEKVTFAIHLLQSDVYVQRMVKSLSSDKSVWDAVLNNEAVQELKKAITAEIDRSSNVTVSNDSPNTKKFIMRISDAAKAKLVEAIEKITKIVNKLFQSARHWKAAHAGKSNSFKEKLRTSVMLSIMIFLIVVVNRVYN